LWEVGKWARGRSWLEVRDRTDRWGPPVSKKKRKEMEKKKGRGCCGLQSAGLAWAFCPRLAQLAAVSFFCSFLFYFLSFVSFRFWIEIKL
jgi:hypothetical protein